MTTSTASKRSFLGYNNKVLKPLGLGNTSRVAENNHSRLWLASSNSTAIIYAFDTLPKVQSRKWSSIRYFMLDLNPSHIEIDNPRMLVLLWDILQKEA